MPEATFYLDLVAVGLLLLALKDSSMPLALRWSMALVVAVAMSSLALVATLALTGTTTWLPMIWLVYLVPIALALRNIRWQVSTTAGQGPAIRFTGWLAVVAVVFAMGAVAVTSYNSPYGGWDAWAIWNLKARFLHFGLNDGSWIGLLSPEVLWSHPDYPLLLPATVSRYWSLLGVASPWIPATMSILTLGLTLCLLHAAVKSCTGQVTANISVLVLLGATFFVQHAGSQFADNYLALIVLAAAIVFRQLSASGLPGCKGWGMPCLLGILLGLAASTKNEGLLIAIVYLVLYLVTLIAHRERDLSAATTSLAALVSAWLLVYFPSLVMKYRAGVGNDVVSAVAIDSIQGSLTWEHASSLFQLISPLAVDFFLIPVVIVVAVHLACYGRFRLAVASTFSFVAPALILSGYVLVLWFTPHDLAWHVNSSFQRLLVHVWGVAVFALGSSISISTTPKTN